MASGLERVKCGDKNYEQTLQKWFDEPSDEEQNDSSEVDNSNDEMFKEDQIIEDDYSSTSEQEYFPSDHEEDSNLEVEAVDDSNSSGDNVQSDHVTGVVSYKGKNGYVWKSEQPNQAVRTPKHNIIIKLPSLKPAARRLGNNPVVREIWKLLFDNDMLNEVVLRTNEKLEIVRSTHKNSDTTDYKNTDLIEINAFIGLLMLTSIFRSNHENMLSLFSNTSTGRPIFRAVMSCKRFEKLLTCIRFDDASTRVQRCQEDPVAAISFLFNRFVDNSQKCFNLGPTTCIDEMLISFRGRCSFKMYMPNKPAKYGLKLLCLTDARNSYFYNGYIYTGKNSDGKTLPDEERKLQKPTQAVLRLVKPIEKTNKNITADNWFSSIELLHQLRKKGLTYTGTLKKNKREIPPEFLPSPKRPVVSTLYGFSDDLFTLMSHVPKKNKAVLLVSSAHHGKATDPDNSLPEIISFYNATKGGVDTLDMKCANYSSGRRTRRWPLAIFYRLIDISTNNSYVLFLHYKEVTPKSRRLFIEELAMQLVKPHMEKRLETQKLNKELQAVIKSALGVDEVRDEPSTSRDERLQTKKTCFLCPYQKTRKTFYKCYSCQLPICLEHASKMCKTCIADKEDR